MNTGLPWRGGSISNGRSERDAEAQLLQLVLRNLRVRGFEGSGRVVRMKGDGLQWVVAVERNPRAWVSRVDVYVRLALFDTPTAVSRDCVAEINPSHISRISGPDLQLSLDASLDIPVEERESAVEEFCDDVARFSRANLTLEAVHESYRVGFFDTAIMQKEALEPIAGHDVWSRRPPPVRLSMLPHIKLIGQQEGDHAWSQMIESLDGQFEKLGRHSECNASLLVRFANWRLPDPIIPERLRGRVRDTYSPVRFRGWAMAADPDQQPSNPLVIVEADIPKTPGTDARQLLLLSIREGANVAESFLRDRKPLHSMAGVTTLIDRVEAL